MYRVILIKKEKTHTKGKQRIVQMQLTNKKIFPLFIFGMLIFNKDNSGNNLL